MKVEAFVYDSKGNESVVVYNDIDIETIVYDLCISFKNWKYASIDYDGGFCIAHSDGTYFIEGE